MKKQQIGTAGRRGRSAILLQLQGKKKN